MEWAVAVVQSASSVVEPGTGLFCERGAGVEAEAGTARSGGADVGPTVWERGARAGRRGGERGRRAAQGRAAEQRGG